MQAATFHARGMHCGGCERLIEDGVRRLGGVKNIKADYATQTVSVTFDPAATSLDAICAVVAQEGYSCDRGDLSPRNSLTKAAGLVIGAAGVIFIIFFAPGLVGQETPITLSPDMSYGLLFVLGLLTGFHCVAMCGAFVLSYTAADARKGRPSYLSHALYGAGKTLSYTAIGGLFGLLGSVITFTPLLRGGAGMLAGAFMIVFGLNMLDLFPTLRRFRLSAPAWLNGVGGAARAGGRPFATGLANGLNIACGPLQALYIMAAGTGSAVEGAKMLFVFGLGTLPVMLSFGVLSSLVSAALTRRLLKASGLILLVLGAVMFHRGLILTGSGFDLHAMIHALSPTHRLALEPLSGKQSAAGFQTIEMEVNRSGYFPNHFTIQKGVPVRWAINGVEITNCNHHIVVPRLGLEFDVKQGWQTIDFIPKDAGVIPWSCWMGMLQGQFDVIDVAPARIPEVANKPAPSAPPVQAEPAAAAKGVGEPPAVLADNSAAEAPVRYTIAAGDSLSGIAKKVYGAPQRWRAIAKANPGLDLRRLRPGQIILLPAGAPKD